MTPEADVVITVGVIDDELTAKVCVAFVVGTRHPIFAGAVVVNVLAARGGITTISGAVKSVITQGCIHRKDAVQRCIACVIGAIDAVTAVGVLGCVETTIRVCTGVDSTTDPICTVEIGG